MYISLYLNLTLLPFNLSFSEDFFVEQVFGLFLHDWSLILDYSILKCLPQPKVLCIQQMKPLPPSGLLQTYLKNF